MDNYDRNKLQQIREKIIAIPISDDKESFTMNTANGIVILPELLQLKNEEKLKK